MSREQLAAEAGLSARTIYAIEVEGVRPQRATRRVLAEALGCTRAEIEAIVNPHDKQRPGRNRGAAEDLADVTGQDPFPKG
jgi:DNA-binding XRE family transcriptional regulator